MTPLPRPNWKQTFAVAGVLLSLGCGTHDRDSSSARVVIGQGESEYETWGDEPSLGLSAGAQGGFHVWVSLLATGFEGFGPNNNQLNLELTTRVIGVEGSDLSVSGQLAMRPSQAGVPLDPRPAVSFSGYPAQVFDARCSHGRRVEVDVELSDDRGNSARDTAVGILQIEERNRGVDCD